MVKQDCATPYQLIFEFFDFVVRSNWFGIGPIVCAKGLVTLRLDFFFILLAMSLTMIRIVFISISPSSEVSTDTVQPGASLAVRY